MVTSRDNQPNHRGIASSLAFWVTLLCSSALLALLVLAPRFETWIDLTNQYVENERIYQDMQQETTRLESMAFALEHDAAYARRLAIRDLDLKPDQLLQVDIEPPGESVPPESSPEKIHSTADPGRLRAIVHEFAIPGRTRTWGIWGAAGLCLFAFICLNDGFFERGPGRRISDLWKASLNRYQKSEPSERW